jgi:hypothetical protein
MSEQLQVGQKGSVKELEYGFEFTVLPADQPGPVIAEVTPDHIVLEDDAAGVVTRIPTYLIKAVSVPGAAPVEAPADAPATVAPPTVAPPIPSAA